MDDIGRPFTIIAGPLPEHRPSNQISQSRLWGYSKCAAPRSFHLQRHLEADMIRILLISIERYHKGLDKCDMDVIHMRTIQSSWRSVPFLIVGAVGSLSVNRYFVGVCTSRQDYEVELSQPAISVAKKKKDFDPESFGQTTWRR